MLRSPAQRYLPTTCCPLGGSAVWSCVESRHHTTCQLEWTISSPLYPPILIDTCLANYNTLPHKAWPCRPPLPTAAAAPAATLPDAAPVGWAAAAPLPAAALVQRELQWVLREGQR